MSERIADQVRHLGLQEHAIVVGSGPLDGLVRTAHDLDLTVDADTYRTLRETHSWQEIRTPDGKPMLTRDGVDVGTAFGRYSIEDLQANSFIEHGVRFAGLPDIYAWKQDTGRQKDLDDLARIRERLYDRPLPVGLLGRELDYVRNCLPEDFSHEPALAVAANGLYIVRTVFGDHRRDVRRYTGSVETQGVPSMYHDVWHSARGAERLARHALRTNQGRLALGQTILFDRSDILAGVAGFSYHDVSLGDGRQSANPAGFDELKAAELSARHLTLSGVTQGDIPAKTYTGIRATGFNEATHRQDVDPSRGYEHIQRAFAGTDLGTFAEPSFVVETMNLAIEDLCRASNEYILGEHAEQQGVRINTPHDALALIDSSPHIRQAFANHLLGSANFCKQYAYPDDWTLDNQEIRTINSQFIRTIGERLLAEELTAVQAYALAKQHAKIH